MQRIIRKTTIRFNAFIRQPLNAIQRILSRRMHSPPGIRLPELAIEIRRQRPDLSQAFDTETRRGRTGLANWLVFHGFHEMGVVADEPTRFDLMAWHRPWPRARALAPMQITWLMYEAARRAGLSMPRLDEREGQLRLLRWYFLVAIPKYNWACLLTDEQASALAATEAPGGIPLIVRWLWDEAPDIRARFPILESPEFLTWVQRNGAQRWPLLANARVRIANRSRPPADGRRPLGVNLIGHPRGRFGIGEDVRMAVSALSAVNIPFVIRDITDGTLAAEDDSINHHISETTPYRFTMFCTTGLDTVRAVQTMPPDAFNGQHVIGFWPWELPEFPPAWQQAYDLVDEIWASSRYTYDAYARGSSMPLRHMPMAVCVDETEGLSRADFGLPGHQFLFIFAYDALSYNARKNPGACIAAFERAFPRGDEPVGLVIKGLRANNTPFWRELERRRVHDKRLHLVDLSLTRGAHLDLYRACDSFVSLHRAEGFGRNIAENMALGKPVIVTAHSGNMDFTTHATSALVKVRLRPLEAGEYPFGTGQVWAEPDVDDAATQMRRMAKDASWRQGLARLGKDSIRRDFGTEAVGRAWAQALGDIGGRCNNH